MAQRISAFGLGGAGIVAVLIIAGIVLKHLSGSASAGELAIWGGVGIGLIFGFLGIIGILITISKRLGM